MKCIILAAEYATKLYPLTKNKPKSLLEISGITILVHIIKKIEKIDSIDYIYTVYSKGTQCNPVWQRNLT